MQYSIRALQFAVFIVLVVHQRCGIDKILSSCFRASFRMLKCSDHLTFENYYRHSQWPFFFHDRVVYAELSGPCLCLKYVASLSSIIVVPFQILKGLGAIEEHDPTIRCHTSLFRQPSRGSSSSPSCHLQ
jgi:hypothetical protein